MNSPYIALVSVLAAFFAWSNSVVAQESDEDATPTVEGEDASAKEADEASTDEVADTLNSQQQLQQTFTLKRTINGEVVETKKATVTLTPGDPYRPTEAGQSVRQQVEAAFDSEVLTRVEAFEEAKLDFTIADVNRDGRMNADEFATLVNSWRESGVRNADAPSEEIAREREYQALLEVIDPEAAERETATYANAKFSFISGAQDSISREDYIREYLLDFDTMDADDDTLLKGEELMRFRAANRGESF